MEEEQVKWLISGLIGSLCPDSAEEAKTLVPSLEGKISDNDLQDLLDEMMRLRNFVQ